MRRCGFLRGVLLLGFALLPGCGERAEDQTPPREGATLDGGSGEPPVILCLGTSLTAGYGVAPEEAWPALLQERLDAMGVALRVVNAGVSGDTSSSGLRRIDWVLRSDLAVLVLELGANDGLRGIPVDLVRSNLEQIVAEVRSTHPDAPIVLAGMRAPPNMGPAYCRQFQETYPELAEAEDLDLVPFLLEGVAADPSLNLPDRIHPSVSGHRVVEENVWRVLEPVLEELGYE